MIKRGVTPIRRGLGRFTPKLWDRLWAAVSLIERYGPALDQLERSGRLSANAVPRQTTFFLALIEGNEDQTNNLWHYAWKEAIIQTGTDTPTYVSADYPRQGTATGDDYAVNLYELNNDGMDQEGLGIDVEALPGTFAFQPIRTNTPVMMFIVRDDAGLLRPVFWAANAVDGAC